MKRILVFLLVISCIIAIHTAVSAAQPGSIAVIGGLTRQSTVQPGGKTEGKILFKNVSDAPAQVRLYQTDYQFGANGKSSYGEPGSMPRSNAKWVQFTPHDLMVAPNESASVYYTVQTPQDDKLTGTYWSIIMAEEVNNGKPTTEKSVGEIQVGIQLKARYAIAIVTNIGETGVRNVKFVDGSIIDEDKKRFLQVALENTGERWLNPTLWAEVFDSSGISLGRVEGNRMRLYPGSSGKFRVDLTNMPKGDFSAIVVADNGDEYVFGSQYKLQIK